MLETESVLDVHKQFESKNEALFGMIEKLRALAPAEEIRQAVEDYRQNVGRELARSCSRSPDVARETERDSCDRPGRNDLCPCGSGKKYKKCWLH